MKLKSVFSLQQFPQTIGDGLYIGFKQVSVYASALGVANDRR